MRASGLWVSLAAMGAWVMLAPSGAGAAEPSESRPPLVVLELEAKGATSLQVTAATQGVTRGLRDLDVFQVLSADDVRQLLALERSRQLMGADSSGLDTLLGSLGARHAVVGSVTQVQGAGLTVEIRLVDTRDAKVLSQKTVGPLPGAPDLAKALPGLAQELVAPLLEGQRGSLLVQSPDEGAEIVVDDVLVASTPMGKPHPLPRGQHRLQVRKDGFIAQARTVRIQPDQVQVEDVRLVPSKDYAEAHALRHQRLRIGAWVATAVAAASLGGALAVDRLATEPKFQNEFQPRRLALDEQDLPVELARDEKKLASYEACRRDLVGCGAEVEDLRGSIRTQQYVSAGLLGLGVIATGAATYLWLTGEDPNRYARLVSVTPGRGGSSFAFSLAF